jgi:Collagen triple helix repeat (20 copies)
MARNIVATVAVAILVSATAAGAAAVIDGGDIRNGSVTGKDIRDKSLTKQDFKGSVRGPQGPPGARGAQGIQGAQGPKGDPGAAGADGLDGFDGAALFTKTRCVACPFQSAEPLPALPRDVPLVDSTWDQFPDEGNMLLVEVTWTPPPPPCTATPESGTLPAGGRVRVLLDGEEILVPEDIAGEPERTDTHMQYVFAPDAIEARSLTATVGDNCQEEGQNTTVDELKIDVATFFG